MLHCKKKSGNFCDCKDLPCKRLKSLDKRYRTKYGMSMIDNLQYIKKHGIRNFLKKEEKKWTRKNEVLCVHDKKWYAIG